MVDSVARLAALAVPSRQSLTRGVALGLAALLVASAARAQGQAPSLIRDTEVENTIRAYGAPLFNAAGLSPESVRIFVINDRALNAFVAGGQNLFINTGLLMRAEHAGQVIGVIAHETGHIAGGHLARTQDALRNASVTSILALVLGAAAAIVSGKPEAGVAVLQGGTQIAERNLLTYSRTQESSADQAGLSFLERTGQSARGLLEFLEILSHEELLVTARQSPYIRSHPLTHERVDAVREFLGRSRFADTPVPAETQMMHKRIRAKLQGFIDPPATTLARVKADDRSIEARYARAVAFYRIPDLGQAVSLIDGLLAELPNDAYFHELKGQILFENGRVADARQPYETAVRLMPDAPLLRVGLAQVQLELNDPAVQATAYAHLREAIRADPDNPLAWRLLAVVHGREGRIGEAALALAEQAMVQNRPRDARQQAERAKKLLPQGSPSWLRAQDIRISADEKLKPQ
jgi:predicted Zn-dependent protease